MLKLIDYLDVPNKKITLMWDPHVHLAMRIGTTQLPIALNYIQQILVCFVEILTFDAIFQF